MPSRTHWAVVLPFQTLQRVAVVLQTEVPEWNVDITTSLGGGAVGAFLTTLLVGGIMIALAPAYTERLMDRVREETVDSFIYGLFSLAALILLAVLLVLTIVGILVVIPLLLIAALIWAIGAAVAFLAIGERLVDSDDGWLKPLLVGALINGGLALTGIGGLISFAVGAAGFGALLRDWQE
jgi:hypothetical protein